MQEEEAPTRKRDRRQEQASKVDEGPPTKSRKPPSKTGKAKEFDADEEDSKEERGKRVKSKPASIAGGQRQSEADTEEDQLPKKKKRKLNVIGGGSSIFSGPAGFTWDQVGVPWSFIYSDRRFADTLIRAMGGTWVFRAYCLLSKRESLFQHDLHLQACLVDGRCGKNTTIY